MICSHCLFNCRSVHVVDLVRWQNSPNFSADDSRKINWGKWASICEHLLQLGSLQRQFYAIDTHDFISRPKVRKILMDMPLMPEEVLFGDTAAESNSYLTRYLLP